MSAIEVEIVPSLAERADRIMGVLETAAVEVGKELLAAKRDHPGDFGAWIRSELPFGQDKAQRLMAVARFADTLDPQVLESLPKAWTILFELRRLAPVEVEAAVNAGILDADTTRVEAQGLTEADLPTFRRLLTGSAEVPTPRERAWKPGPRPGSIPAANRILDTDSLARELISSPRSHLSKPIETLLRAWMGDLDA